MGDSKKGTGQFLTGLGIAGANMAGGLIGQSLDIGGKKQHGRQKELMGMQYKNQLGLNTHGQQLAMKTWRETNYPAQMEMLREAGLNPALIYGQGGAGGATTNAGSGGSASSGSAGATQSVPMDIGNAMATMSSIALQKEQRKILAEQAKQAEIETLLKEKGLEDKLSTEEIKAYTDYRKAQGDKDVMLGHNEGAGEWKDGKKVNRYEEAELEKLKGVGIDNLVKQAQQGLSKATASNLLSNDELIRLQTRMFEAQMGVIESEEFKKLPKGLQGIIMMVIKKLGGI